MYSLWWYRAEAEAEPRTQQRNVKIAIHIRESILKNGKQRQIQDEK